MMAGSLQEGKKKDQEGAKGQLVPRLLLLTERGSTRPKTKTPTWQSRWEKPLQEHACRSERERERSSGSREPGSRKTPRIYHVKRSLPGAGTFSKSYL